MIYNESELYCNAQYNNNTQTQMGGENKSLIYQSKNKWIKNSPKDIGTKVKDVWIIEVQIYMYIYRRH